MAISFISHAGGSGDSISLPSYVSGDFAIVYAHKHAGSPPDLPAGWTNVASGQRSGAGFRIGYKFLVTDSSTGTWTNAAEVQVSIYRGVSPFTPIGGIGTPLNDNGGDVSVPAVAIQDTTYNLSWVVAFFGHDIGSSYARTIATLTTRSGNHVTAQNLYAGDTNGGVGSFSQPASINVGASGSWISESVEIKANITRTIVGDVTVSLSPEAGFVRTRPYVGSITLALTPAATFVRRRVISGSAEIDFSVVAGLLRQKTYTGNVGLSFAVSGSPMFGRYINGQVNVGISVNGTMEFRLWSPEAPVNTIWNGEGDAESDWVERTLPGGSWTQRSNPSDPTWTERSNPSTPWS